MFRLNFLPSWLWIAICGAVGRGALTVLHNRHAERQIEAAFNRGWDKRDEQYNVAVVKAKAEAQLWKERYEKSAADLTALRSETHAQNLRDIAADADDLRLRGPGAAAGSCAGSSDRPRSASTSGGSESTPAPADAPVAPLPAEQPLAVVPWGDLVRRAEEHDALRDEALTWRTWYLDNAAALAKAKSELPTPNLGYP